MSTETERCSARSLGMGEPMIGTASTVSDWVMLEHPGPWGTDALRTGRLSPATGRRLRKLSTMLRARVVLIREHGRTGGPGPVRCFFAHTGPDRPWLERLTLPTHEDLFDLDLSPMRSGAAPGVGEPDGGPLFLVCTHGRRDPCCAERGRPVAQALAPRYGGRLWESSHIGGDRFAANLVCFPHGVYLGRLDPATGRAAAGDYERGHIDLEHYRGRCCHPFAVQAAETLIRRHEQLTGLEDLRLVRTEHPAPHVVTATFEGAGARMLTRSVRVQAAQSPRGLTCHALEEARPPTYTDLGP